MTSEQSSAQGGAPEVIVARTSKPVLTPDAFDGDIRWDEWIDKSFQQSGEDKRVERSDKVAVA